MDTLAAQLSPTQTSLFLGAGASVQSGGPTGADLARWLWNELTADEDLSDELVEVCSILENRLGRRPLVEAVRRKLSSLQPAGGTLLLPNLRWKSLYTTNFDRVIELAYSRSGAPISVVRSNFDFNVAERAGCVLYKMHGCISQDSALGGKGNMLLTERDYEEHGKYREALFKKLDSDLYGGDVVFVGSSLRDSHLRTAVMNAARAKEESGAPGRIFAVIFEASEDRAQVLERKGVQVAFGDLDALLERMLGRADFQSDTPKTDDVLGFRLPEHLYLSAADVTHALTLGADANRLFNGSPATYADIHCELTFSRDCEQRFSEDFLEGAPLFWIITGVAGVGKTTLARRLLMLAAKKGWRSWEHQDEALLRAEDWVAVEASMRAAGQQGLLFVDECLQLSRQLSVLAERLCAFEKPALKLVLTASHAQWARRTKSPLLVKRGVLTHLSRLSPSEIDDLLLLLERQPLIKGLVQNEFARLTPVERRRHLRQRCSADMYVCLKNIFAFESLDTILLREYGDLPEDLRDIYRHVAALQASGTRVHRQLIVRCLDVQAEIIPGVLAQLSGIVDEYDIDVKAGLYGWTTRHLVIATTISQYKFSDQTELYTLLGRVVESLNPAIPLELRTLRDLCNADFGVSRLQKLEAQLDIYKRLIALAPGERIPRHRLIATLLRHRRIDMADQSIREAEAAVGLDSPINRYKVLQAIQRAEETEGILPEDRMAMLRHAEQVALAGLQRFSHDKYPYLAYGSLGLAVADMSGDTSILDDAIARMRRAWEVLLDNMLDDNLRMLEERRRQMQRSAARA